MFRVSKAMLVQVVHAEGTQLKQGECYLATAKYWIGGKPMIDLAKHPDSRVDSYPPSYQAGRFVLALPPEEETFMEAQIDEALSIELL